MAAAEIKIDDDYVTEMGKYIQEQFEDLDEAYQLYIQIMLGIKSHGIMKGDTADAIEAFIEYAQAIEGQINELGESAKKLCNNYITDVDLIDQYLF